MSVGTKLRNQHLARFSVGNGVYHPPVTKLAISSSAEAFDATCPFLSQASRTDVRVWKLPQVEQFRSRAFNCRTTYFSAAYLQALFACTCTYVILNFVFKISLIRGSHHGRPCYVTLDSVV